MLKYTYHLTLFICVSYFTGEYKTDVREVEPDERPIVGQSKSLRCYNSEENKGNPEAERNAVRWFHNGQTVKNDERHDGASTRVLKYYSDFTSEQVFQDRSRLEVVCIIHTANTTILNLATIKLQIFRRFHV